MGQGDPGRQHQAAGMKPRPKIGKTFHNVSFRERGALHGSILELLPECPVGFMFEATRGARVDVLGR